ncbi:hypothetical protein CK203_058230 [Vitis vinifera]|uniref:Uncharacterized protein n=1 Tax=Vitis vinifera TaxID=29760 RepID=A0A438H5W7_VITVI|nr:hypothetical protein CK203_058230 [Vitis vinifera]
MLFCFGTPRRFPTLLISLRHECPHRRRLSDRCPCHRHSLPFSFHLNELLAMARLFRFCIALTLVLFLVEFVVVVNPLELSPAPVPKSDIEDVAPLPHALSPQLSPIAPSPFSYFRSPSVSPLALEFSPSPLSNSSSASTPSSTPSSFDSGDVG